MSHLILRLRVLRVGVLTGPRCSKPKAEEEAIDGSQLRLRGLTVAPVCSISTSR